MSCTVQKFGGTSVATLDRIKNVAEIIARARSKNDDVIAVVSAMAGVTNKFVEYAVSLDSFEGDPEYDCVVSSGELVTSGLLAIALRNIGIASKSYASWQVPIFTNSNYGQAVIQSVEPDNLIRDVKNGIVPVVCGFQGVSRENRITTLGRGGSDLTAVAVASAVNANMCEIYSDVDGVYTVDPNIYPEAKRIDRISYHEMLAMASQGAKVLQEQSVDYAMRKNVVVRVASSFIDEGGTIISGEAPAKQFCGLAVTHNLCQIGVSHNGESNLHNVLNLLKNNFIHYEILNDNSSGKVNIMIDKKKSAMAIGLFNQSDSGLNARQEFSGKSFSRVSVIGASLSKKDRDNIVTNVKNYKIDAIGCSMDSYRINLIVSSNQLLETVDILHKFCGLYK